MCVCVWGGGGGGGGGGGQGAILCCCFNAIFSISELDTKSFSCQTNRIWKNNFMTTILTRIF